MEIQRAETQKDDSIEQFKAAAMEVVQKAKESKGDDSISQLMKGLEQAIKAMNAPKKIVRDDKGKAIGVEAG
jgi:predicted RecB family endonuclease